MMQSGQNRGAHLVKISHPNSLPNPLEETNDTTRLGVKPDLPKARARPETGHRLHVAEDRVEEACAGGKTDGANRDREARRDTFKLRIVGEGVLGLRHANWAKFEVSKCLVETRST